MKFNSKFINPVFLVSVLVLILNDFLLKSIFHNAITGKLSDFAWLFAMPFFLSIFYSKQARNIHVFVGIFFVFFKSEFSQSTLNWINSFGFEFYRVTDFTDNICLVSILFSYYVFRNQPLKIIHPVFGILSIAFSCFAFIADTQRREPVEEYSEKELIELNLKTLNFKNISDQKRIVIVNFKYTNQEFIKSNLEYKQYSKIDTLIIDQHSDGNVVTPINQRTAVKFPKSFCVIVKDTLGRLIAKYDTKEFLYHEKKSELVDFKKEVDEDYWAIDIGYNKNYIDEEEVIGEWKKISGKFHYDFKLDHINYCEDDYLKEGDLIRRYKNNTLIVDFYAGKSYGKITRLKNDSLTIKWNNKDVVEYVKL